MSDAEKFCCILNIFIYDKLTFTLYKSLVDHKLIIETISQLLRYILVNMSVRCHISRKVKSIIVQSISDGKKKFIATE